MFIEYIVIVTANTFIQLLWVKMLCTTSLICGPYFACFLYILEAICVIKTAGLLVGGSVHPHY